MFEILINTIYEYSTTIHDVTRGLLLIGVTPECHGQLFIYLTYKYKHNIAICQIILMVASIQYIAGLPALTCI